MTDPARKLKRRVPDTVEMDVNELRSALRMMVNAEWMVSHDWGGDRETVLRVAKQALRRTARRRK